jgi:hypothetical protein
MVHLFGSDNILTLFLLVMEVTITVFKLDIESHKITFKRIEEMSSAIKEFNDCLVFSPKAGRLFEILNILKENSVDYKTDFNVAEEILRNNFRPID